jgi:hypothetical protein
MEINETYVTQCGHYFHQKCLEEYCSVPERSICPLCKMQINFQIPLPSTNYSSSQTSASQPRDNIHVSLLGDQVNVQKDSNCCIDCCCTNICVIINSFLFGILVGLSEFLTIYFLMIFSSLAYIIAYIIETILFLFLLYLEYCNKTIWEDASWKKRFFLILPFFLVHFAKIIIVIVQFLNIYPTPSLINIGIDGLNSIFLIVILLLLLKMWCSSSQGNQSSRKN